MDDHVKRSDAVNAIDEALNRVFVTPIGTDIMRNVPAADVAPVVHGRWIFEPGLIPHCSVCGRYSDDADTGDAKWCAFCGARMDKEDT